jgi:hypothetical protein
VGAERKVPSKLQRRLRLNTSRSYKQTKIKKENFKQKTFEWLNTITTAASFMRASDSYVGAHLVKGFIGSSCSDMCSRLGWFHLWVVFDGLFDLRSSRLC